MESRMRRLVSRRGAVIVEFALVIPFLALIVFGVIDFSRAYGQMNALDSSLREGARYGSKWKNYASGNYSSAVKLKVKEYGNVYGFSGLDTTRISVSLVNTGAGGATEAISVTVTNHPIPLPVLSRFLGVPALSLTRTVTYRWECAGLAAASCT